MDNSCTLPLNVPSDIWKRYRKGTETKAFECLLIKVNLFSCVYVCVCTCLNTSPIVLPSRVVSNPVS